MNTEETRALDRVLAALTAPAHPDELEGRDRALAAFREAAAGPSPASRPPARRRLPTGRLPLRIGVAALCATLLGGGVAVATGARLPLPGAGEETRSAAPEKGPRLVPKKAPSPVPATTAPAARPTPYGPPAPGFAELCRRILREKKGRRWRPEPAGPRGGVYAALVRAAGGPDQVYGYCLALGPRGSGPSAGPDDRPNGRPEGRPNGPEGGPAGGPRPGEESGDRDGWDRGDGDRPSARPGRTDRPGGSSRPGRPGRR